MARWRPDASQRLVVAALELFEERGFESTTVIEIAERAGLTKSTFFRHFPDKREVLFGGDTISGLLVSGIAAAPAVADPLDALAHALDTIGRRAFTPDRREFSVRRQAVIAAHPELREREALKGLGLTASMVDALERRGVPVLVACVAAELGALAWKIAFARWCDTTNDDEFGDLARRTLAEVRAASALLLAADKPPMSSTPVDHRTSHDVFCRP